jgi:hypothetical protein
MRSRAIVATICALGALAASPLRGQTIRGRLVDAANHVAVPGALAELRDEQGKVIQQAFSSPSGAFLFVASPNQRYLVRVAAIGFARHAAVRVTLGADPVVLPDIVLTAIVVTLPELRAMIGKRACGKSELNAETFGGLLESARTSLQLMDATLRSAQLGFETQTIHTITVKTARDSSRSSDTTAGVLHAWPVRSLSLDSLQAVGFQRAKTPEEGTGHFYYGPDLQVLFSDWFLDTHCFTLDKNLSKGDTVFIQFDPTGKQRNVDISGQLVLDRVSLTMRRLTYTHRNLPDGLPDRAAGGEMRFAEKSAGLWVPVDWAIWAPITKSQRQIARPTMILMAPGQRMSPGAARVAAAAIPPPLVQVVGRDEQRGRLMRIVPLGGP